MDNRTLIIQLLVQDMKHEQLIASLSKSGFASDMHGLGISAIIAQLMGISAEGQQSEWYDMYMSFMAHAAQYPLTGNGSNLLSLATDCYTSLSACVVGLAH